MIDKNEKIETPLLYIVQERKRDIYWSFNI